MSSTGDGSTEVGEEDAGHMGISNKRELVGLGCDSQQLSYFHLLMAVLTFANPFAILCGALSPPSNFVLIDG